LETAWALRFGALTSFAFFKQFLAGQALYIVGGGARGMIEQAGLRTTDFFFGLAHTGFLTRKNLDALLRCLPEGTSELMCHPGYVDDDLRRTGTRLLWQREEEFRSLAHQQIFELVRQRNVATVTYKENDLHETPVELLGRRTSLQ